MAANISNLECNFCGLAQAATQPQCVGCGAGLPLMTGELKTNKKLLEMATQMNSLLAKENARAKGTTKLTRLRIGVAAACVGSVLWAASYSFSGSYSQVYAEEELRRESAINARYTRALEMELYSSEGRLPQVEP